ncbi:MAG: amidohydrolase family protein [Candidatus Acidiferrales bacterium]
MSKVELDNRVAGGPTSTASEHPVQQITTRTDSREILANARRDITRLHLDDYFIVDVDAHHVEFDSWADILKHLENPVLRHNAIAMTENWPNAKQLAFSNHPVGLTFQDVFGRIPHQCELGEYVERTDEHRDLTLVRRAMDSLGIKMQVVFPQPMLEMGLHPEPDIVTAMTFAYNRWFTRTILPREKRVKTLLCLPFHDPDASLKMIQEFGETPGVVGFMITSQRHAGVHKNMFMRIYRELEERGLPLAFHAGPTWGDTMTSTMNRFLSVHSMSFVTCNMTHLTNWIVNGLPERFPKLKLVWIESGLAWVPFMMQRLDHEYLMRQSDAPLLKRLPSEYISEMYFTSQPLEMTIPHLLEATFKAVHADTQLMYSSDWPHWDFDVPSRIAELPFLNQQAKRNILGETARKLFKL